MLEPIDPTLDDAYIGAHVVDALARDPRVGELRINVTVDAHTVRLEGVVPTEDRRTVIVEVVAELLPGHQIANAIEIQSVEHDGHAEVV